jgi:hypothetical protein
LQSRPAIFLAVHQRVRQKLFIVPGRKIGSLVGAARLGPIKGGESHGFGDVEHKREFQRGD